MTIRIALAIGAACVVAGCASQPKEETIGVAVGPNGEIIMTVDENGELDVEAFTNALLAAGALIAEQEAAGKTTLEDDEIWQEIDGGHVLHIPSGAYCPAQWAEIDREREVIFAPDGTDVGCNYANNTFNFVTFYVFQRDHGLDEEWDVAHGEITARQPVAKEEPFSAAWGNYRATSLSYRTADGEPARTSLLLAESGGWLLKLRISCLADACPIIERQAALGFMGQYDRLASRAPEPLAPSPAPT